tara:strand:+ start:285 stop:791 length:507 start_codon:yes stop_codon:yes gene_type:complete
MTPYESKLKEKLEMTINELKDLGYIYETEYKDMIGYCAHYFHPEFDLYPTYTFDPFGRLIKKGTSKVKSDGGSKVKSDGGFRVKSDGGFKVKSDGGSSSYYTLDINGTKVETEDIIRDVFDNDFDFGNAFKSLVRAYLNTHGKGKEGNDLAYELNKINYSINKIRGVK